MLSEGQRLKAIERTSRKQAIRTKHFKKLLSEVRLLAEEEELLESNEHKKVWCSEKETPILGKVNWAKGSSNKVEGKRHP